MRRATQTVHDQTQLSGEFSKSRQGKFTTKKFFTGRLPPSPILSLYLSRRLSSRSYSISCQYESSNLVVSAASVTEAARSDQPPWREIIRSHTRSGYALGEPLGV